MDYYKRACLVQNERRKQMQMLLERCLPPGQHERDRHIMTAAVTNPFLLEMMAADMAIFKYTSIIEDDANGIDSTKEEDCKGAFMDAIQQTSCEHPFMAALLMKNLAVLQYQLFSVDHNVGGPMYREIVS